MSVSSLSSIMEEQIEDTLVKVNILMSQVSESMSAVSSVHQFLPIVSELLLKIHSVVSHKVPVANIDTTEDQDLWWDSTPEMITYSEDTLSDSDTSILSTTESLFSLSAQDDRNIFIKNISSFLSLAAPSGVFSRRKSKRRRAKKMRRLVHPDLFNIWYYSGSGQITSPTRCQVQACVSATISRG